MSSKIVLSVLCLAGHPESVFPYTVVLYYGGPPKRDPPGTWPEGLKVASVATILASRPVLGGPSRGPSEPLRSKKVPPKPILAAKKCWKSSFEALFEGLERFWRPPEVPWLDPWILGEDPWGRPPGWTPGFWPDPWILAGPLDFALDPGFRQISEISSDFGVPGRFWCWRSDFGAGGHFDHVVRL